VFERPLKIPFCAGMVWVQRQGFPRRLDALVPALHREVSDCHIVICFREVGPQTNGFLGCGETFRDSTS